MKDPYTPYQTPKWVGWVIIGGAVLAFLMLIAGVIGVSRLDADATPPSGAARDAVEP